MHHTRLIRMLSTNVAGARRAFYPPSAIKQRVGVEPVRMLRRASPGPGVRR
jgi:hypothetical protein